MLWFNFLVLPLRHPFTLGNKGSQEGIELNTDFTFSERYIVSEQVALDQFLLKNMNGCQNGFTWLHFFFFFPWQHWDSKSKLHRENWHKHSVWKLSDLIILHEEDQAAQRSPLHDLPHSTTQWSQVFHICAIFLQTAIKHIPICNSGHCEDESKAGSFV